MNTVHSSRSINVPPSPLRLSWVEVLAEAFARLDPCHEGLGVAVLVTELAWHPKAMLVERLPRMIRRTLERSHAFEQLERGVWRLVPPCAAASARAT